MREKRGQCRVFSTAEERLPGLRQGPARRLLPVFLLCVLLPLAACGGDEKSEERVDGEVRVWALSEPGPTPAPEELARAQRMVDYANLADRTLAELCGRYPDFFKLGLAEYATTFSTLGFGVDKPRANCLKKALSPSPGLFPDEERTRLVKDLETMDALREDMHKEYRALRAYVKDRKVVDDGKKGRQLVKRLETLLERYADSLENYQTLVDRAAARAQDVMLKDHPLRDHVHLATDLVSVIRKVAERIALHDPDPGWLDAPMARLNEEIVRAERLPFPVPGETEMHYRQFLKAVRGLVDVLRQGQLESFRPEVRKSMNERWRACLAEYNAFVDALAATPTPRPQGL